MNEIMDCKILPNYQNICRTCLSETNELISVFTNSKFKSKTYAEMIMACTSLQILQTDEVSLKICPICIHEIEQSYLFYKKCQEAHFVLQFSHKFYITSQIESNSLKNNIQSTYVDSVSGQTNQTINDEIKCDNYGEGLEDNGNDLTLSKFDCGTLSTCILISIADQTNEMLNEEAKCDDFEESIAEQYNKSNNDLSGSDFDRASLSPDILIPANDQTDELTNKDVDSIDIEVKVTDQSNKSNNGLSEREFDCAPQVDISTRKQTDQKLENKITSSLNKDEENKIVQCKLCFKSWISQLSLEKHLKSHLKQTYGCDECSLKFSTPARLRKHKNVHRTDKMYVCNICNLSFLGIRYLKIHKILHLNKKKFICDECGLIVSSSDSLTIHKSIHDGTNKSHQCEICGVKFDQNSLARHMYVHKTSKRYICDKCGRDFIFKADLIRHNMKCAGIPLCKREKLYKCSICSNSYTTKQRLTEHWGKKHQTELNEVNSGDELRRVRKPQFRQPKTICTDKRLNEREQLYKCSVCSKSFTSNQYLSYHCQTKHPKLKQDTEYNCIHCKRTFNSKYFLDRHLPTHTFTLQTSCKICKKNFDTFGKLQEHRKSEHIPNKKCQCQVCGKFLATPTTLENHMLIHTNPQPHKCSFCDKKFNRLAGKYSHERLHTGEKPFSCIQCNKSFRHHTTLVEHNRLHTGERPYKCFICNKGFYGNSNLKKHLITHK